MTEVVCPRCRAELDPAVGVCPNCGESVRLAASENEPAWRQQIRETVQRRKKQREHQITKREEEGRQLSIFPDAVGSTPAGEWESMRQRRAEIRARVEGKLGRPKSRLSESGPGDAGELRIPVGSTSVMAASAVELDVVLNGRDEPEDDLPDVDVSVEGVPVQEAETVQVELASAGERFAGALVDLGIVALMLLALTYLTLRVTGYPLVGLPGSALAALGVIGTLLAAGYFLFFWSLSGQTLGKLLTGTRVVAVEGGPLGLGRSLVRGLGLLGALLPLGLGLVGLWSSGGRCWHDRLASTKVIRT